MGGPKLYLHTGTFKTCLDNMIALTANWPTERLCMLFNTRSRYYMVVDDTFLQVEHNEHDDNKMHLVLHITKSELMNLHKYFDNLQLNIDFDGLNKKSI